MKDMYALKTMGKYEFFCISKTKKELIKNESVAFNNWRGMQADGSDKTIEDFMVNYMRVKVTIEKI